jgi:hypothetical protein
LTALITSNESTATKRKSLRMFLNFIIPFLKRATAKPGEDINHHTPRNMRLINRKHYSHSSHTYILRPINNSSGTGSCVVYKQYRYSKMITQSLCSTRTDLDWRPLQHKLRRYLKLEARNRGQFKDKKKQKMLTKNNNILRICSFVFIVQQSSFSSEGRNIKMSGRKVGYLVFCDPQRRVQKLLACCWRGSGGGASF